MSKQNQIQCPDCDAEITLNKDMEKGEVIHCKECSAGLEVTSLQPFAVSNLPKMDEDWGE